ncbi:MAG: DUF4238 domain-containing protein [Burkholderiaceae bacterium]|nr:DUF4238 domain-containing protein [Burkholderiaceae bacterium]
MTKRKPAGPKSHHYVPQSYLRRFTDADGFLTIFDRARGHFRRQRPVNVMKIDSYYRQAWAPAHIDPNILETHLAGTIEHEGAAAIEKLVTTPASLTGDEAAALVSYIEFQRIRVPRQAAWAKELMRQLLLDKIGPELRAELKQKNLRVEMKDSVRFDYMRAALGKLHPWFGRMEWEIYEAVPGTAFITTDSPVSFVNEAIPPIDGEAGIGLAGTLLLFPLDSRKLLVMRHPECVSADPMHVLPTPAEDSAGVPMAFGVVFDAEKVRQTNWYLAHLSYELCVAESETPLREALGI